MTWLLGEGGNGVCWIGRKLDGILGLRPVGTTAFVYPRYVTVHKKLSISSRHPPASTNTDTRTHLQRPQQQTAGSLRAEKVSAQGLSHRTRWPRGSRRSASRASQSGHSCDGPSEAQSPAALQERTRGQAHRFYFYAWFQPRWCLTWVSCH